MLGSLASMSASNIQDNNSSVMEPSTRMKQLVEMSRNISINRDISIAKYFNSGRELIKSAAAFEEKGDIEKAFLLYLRYMTLFIEKIIHHPEYSKVDRAEKTLVKNECNNIFELAEGLKKRIMEKYTFEYEQHFKQQPEAESGSNEKILKKSVEPYSSSPYNCDIDDIDKKFNFSQQPSGSQQEKGFDPFNVEELKQSFDVVRD